MATPGVTSTTPKSDSGVAELQRVLKAYVQVTGYAAADPGTIDGIMGVKTATAVTLLLPRIPNVPSEVQAMTPVMIMLMATEDGKKQVFALLTKYASALAAGIIGMEAYRAGTSSTSQPGTPTASGGKSILAVLTSVQLTPSTAPVTSTGVATQPQLSIWYFDGKKYRIAVPRSNTLAGIVDYVEVAPSVSQPNFGTQVARSIFMKAIGHWWATPLGITAIVGGVVVTGGLAYVGTRALMR